MNRNRITRLTVILLLILMQQMLFGCTSSKTDLNQPLKKYITKTPLPTKTIALPVTNTPQPTPTPQFYEVAQNDTLTGIAKKFGITMETLALANPQVLPSSLSVGQKLVIPMPGQLTPQVVLTPSPGLSVSEPACHIQPDGALCVAMVNNSSTSDHTDILVRFYLFGPAGNQLSEHDGVLIFNTLPADKSLPAYVFIPGQQGPAMVSAYVVSGYAVDPATPPKNFTFADVIKNISWDGIFATIQAVVSEPGDGTVSAVWVAAIAKDANGHLAGFRRWEWAGNDFPADGLPVELSITSFGSPITGIELFVEEVVISTP